MSVPWDDLVKEKLQLQTSAGWFERRASSLRVLHSLVSTREVIVEVKPKIMKNAEPRT